MVTILLPLKMMNQKPKLRIFGKTKFDEGKLSFRILTQDPIKKHKLTLDNLPEELPTRTMKC